MCSKLKACVQQFRRTLKTNTWQGDVAEIRYDNGGTNTPIRVWELDFTRELERRTETTDVTFLCHLQDIHYMIVNKRCKRRIACIQLQEIIVGCRCNWTHCLLRMTDTRILRFAYEYTQTGKRTLDRPRKERDQHPRKHLDGLYATILLLKMICLLFDCRSAVTHRVLELTSIATFSLFVSVVPLTATLVKI